MMKTVIPVLSLAALAACGGGGGGGSAPTPGSFLDPGSTQSFALSTISIAGDTASTNSDAANGALISLAGLNGQFNGARDRIDFENDGGTADILTDTTTQVALFNAKPKNAEPFMGVIGVPTAMAALPTGNVTYDGASSARFVIIDGNTGATFDVTGDVLATADFDGATLDLTFDNFAGTSVIGVAAPVAVSDVGVLEIDDATLALGAFSGGTADFIRGADFATDMSLSTIVTVSGGVFGPTGEELAGVVIVQDSTADLLFSGGFTAN